ncbi:unnamed protein product [Leuciscus chuanchicus]
MRERKGEDVRNGGFGLLKPLLGRRLQVWFQPREQDVEVMIEQINSDKWHSANSIVHTIASQPKQPPHSLNKPKQNHGPVLWGGAAGSPFHFMAPVLGDPV